jgi:hypothetical protein
MCDDLLERDSLKAQAERASEQTSEINYSFIPPNSTARAVESKHEARKTKPNRMTAKRMMTEVE